jgi:hypothetical protein
MKTIKIFLSIAGFALTTICFGQLLTGYPYDIPDYTAYINSNNNHIEQHVYRYPARITAGDHFEMPLISSNYFLPLENDLEAGTWTTAPFEINYYEKEIAVEPWMTAPFESNYYEKEIAVEPWMTAPFESNYYEKEIAVEPWMTAPFESNYYEKEIAVEPWMTHPWI